MKIKYYCPLWGSEDLGFDEFCTKVKEAGYHGIEMSFPMDPVEKSRMLKTIVRHDLSYIAQHWETRTPDFAEHKKAYVERLHNLASCDPKFINTHTGRDFFSFEQNMELIHLAEEVSKETGVAVYHETHRGRFGFAAHIALTFLEAKPDLKLSADFSHWCCVAESELDDQQIALNAAINRSFHIHARIGFEGGPQITDPRLSEWEDITKKFIGWWQRIVDIRRREGIEELSVTSEFGPFPYMVRTPETLEPIVNQWDVNLHMKNLLKKKLII